MEFRKRLLGTLRAFRPVLEAPGVLVVGSEVPNLLEPGAASTLVVSRDVDLCVPIENLGEVKRRLAGVTGLRQSAEEPSVFVPHNADLIEVNLLGMDRAFRDPRRAYVHEDPDLPLMVFGALALIEPGPPLRIEDLRVPLPRISGLLVEKLLTERSGEKGDRDLLVALGLLMLAGGDDLHNAVSIVRTLPDEVQHAVRSNLTILSLLEPRAGMPDPRPHRPAILDFLRSLETGQGGRG